MMEAKVKQWLEDLKQGKRRALSRVLSLVEEQDQQAFDILESLFEHTGKAISIGFTGAPGAGKSTLIDQCVKAIRQTDQKASVLAVDPSSPFSGGAVLGDRIRMQRHSADEGVYIRSVGSRGKSGGVSFATRALLQVLDVYGSEYNIVETVGAGQSEVDIMHLVDTTIVVLTPESGDGIQALKAGMLEIADVYVINKKDRDGADRMAHTIEMMLSLSPEARAWEPPIIQTCAQSGEGVDVLMTGIKNHQEHLKTYLTPPEELSRKRRAFLIEMLQTRLSDDVLRWIEEQPGLKGQLQDTQEPNLYGLVKHAMTSLSR